MLKLLKSVNIKILSHFFHFNYKSWQFLLNLNFEQLHLSLASSTTRLWSWINNAWNRRWDKQNRQQKTKIQWQKRSIEAFISIFHRIDFGRSFHHVICLCLDPIRQKTSIEVSIQQIKASYSIWWLHFRWHFPLSNLHLLSTILSVPSLSSYVIESQSKFSH